MKRAIPFLVLLLATTACGGRIDSGDGAAPPGGNAGDAAARTADVAIPDGESTRESGPDIGTTAAPDVAFAYRYGFRLAAGRIAGVQDQHQQLCERYGLARCRITGMNYRQANAEDVEASLAFLVDPAIAGAFGREAAQRVGAADGSVAESEITGTDAGSPLRANQRSRADLEADLARIETRLRGLDVMSAEKSGLEAQAAQLREQIRNLREQGNQQQASLAMTPMVFNYGSGRFAPGPAGPVPIAETARQSGEIALFGLGLLLRLVIVLAPWILVALLGWWGVRTVRRRRAAADGTETA